MVSAHGATHVSGHRRHRRGGLLVFKARYEVEAHVLEGRSGGSSSAAAYGVHRGWIYKLLARYREGGLEALEPRSRRPRSSPAAMSTEAEEAILRLRRELQSAGDTTPAHTRSPAHLASRARGSPLPSTIWRVLKRHGLIVPQPAEAPDLHPHPLRSRTAQRDVADRHHDLGSADGQPAEILDLIDDHSRLLLASDAYHRAKATDIIATFRQASPATRPALLAALRQRRGLHRLFPTRKGALGAASSSASACS